jgi:hypothetical protein
LELILSLIMLSSEIFGSPSTQGLPAIELPLRKLRVLAEGGR